MSKKKTYVLTVSKQFMQGHPKAGQHTLFAEKILLGQKIHTIRGNYELWKKRADEVNAGKAILSLRCWTGKPYNSKQEEFATLEKVGVQKVLFDDYLCSCQIDEKRFSVSSEMIAENDGLSFEDFENWFYKHDFSKPLAIIHFSDFRYE